MNPKPTIMLALLLGAWASPASAAPRGDLMIVVSPEQQSALGLSTVVVVPTENVPGPLLPARVVMPNANQQVVTARSSAVVESLAFSVGESVEAGETLATLQSPDFVESQRAFLEALVRKDMALELATREETLAREGIVAGRRSLEAHAQVREAETRLAERRHALVLAGASEDFLRALERSRRLVPTLPLDSPSSGIVLEQYVRAGERVQTGDPIYRLGRIERLELEIHTPLDRAHAIEAGTGFEIPESGASGHVLAIGREVHSVDQGIVVRGVIEVGVDALRPGQFVRVRLSPGASRRAAYRIPSNAVVRVSGASWVFVARDAGFRPIEVEILGGSDQELIVAGDFDAGAVVAARGTSTLKALWLAMEEQ